MPPAAGLRLSAGRFGARPRGAQCRGATQHEGRHRRRHAATRDVRGSAMRVGHGRKLGRRPWGAVKLPQPGRNNAKEKARGGTDHGGDPPPKPGGPPTRGGQAPKARRPRFRSVMALGLLTCAVVLGGTAAVIWMRSGAANPGATIVSATTGQTREEIQRQLDREVQENMMTVSVLPTLRLDEQTGELTAGLENDTENRFAQRFSISQDEEVVYVSDPVMPGERLETVTAEKAKVGPAKIEIQALDPETLRAHGSPTAVEVSVAGTTNEE